MLKRPTAVKLIAPDKASPAHLARFEREVMLTAGLTHPNTVAIYDYGRTSEGVFYYAMEYLDGLTLEALVAVNGPQPAARVIHLLKQACGALAEAHDVGLVHRDIKPANLVLCPRGGDLDVIKVLDFGMVKQVAQQDGVQLSAENSILGTPLYIAPESIISPDSTDRRADLYSLGAVAYYLLAGTHVFTGASAMEVFAHHMHTAPVPPSERLGRPVHAGLEELVMRCLSKNPADRPARARDLSRALDGLGLSWTPADAEKWWSGHRERKAGESPAPRETFAATRLTVDVSRI